MRKLIAILAFAALSCPAQFSLYQVPGVLVPRYLPADVQAAGEGMQFEDGQQMQFEDGSVMLYEN